MCIYLHTSRLSFMHQVCEPCQQAVFSADIHVASKHDSLLREALACIQAQATHRLGSPHKASPAKAAATSKMRRLRAMWKSLVTTDSRLRACHECFTTGVDVHQTRLG